VTDLTRRELLRFLLGPPIAAACRREERAPIRFEGAIAGADDRLGHLLRAGFRPTPHLVSRRPIVIVGGGIAGLSAAWRLSRAGVEDYRILELDERPGGTACGGGNAVSSFPWGAHYLPCPLPHARAVELLLLEMGVAEKDPSGRLVFDEAQLCRAPQERLFVGDRWYEGLYPAAGATARDLDELARFQAEVRRLSALRDARGRRAFAVPMEHGSDDADLVALDRLSMAEWLASRGLAGERIRWYAEYGCRDDYGTALVGTSAWAGLHYHASRTERGGHDDLLTWPEGNARIVAHLAKRAGRRLETGRVVTGVELLPRGAAISVFDPATLRCERIHADHAVLALPRVAAARVLPARRLVEEARAFQAGPWIVANLTLHRQPRSRGFPRAWAHPDIASCVERLDAWRWGHAMIRPRPGFVFGAERRRAREPLGDVHFAHTDLSGLPLLEEAQYHGVRAAEEILAKRGVRFESLL
jgi:monoamine oxidase